MVWRNRLAMVVFGVGALWSVAWASRGVRDALALLNAGAGVLGSSSEFGLLRYVLPVFFNVWIARRLCSRGMTERMLRRLHLIATLTLVTIFVLFVVQAMHRFDALDNRLALDFLSGAFIAGAVWLPLQVFFGAGFVALMIAGGRARSDDHTNTAPQEGHRT